MIIMSNCYLAMIWRQIDDLCPPRGTEPPASELGHGYWLD
jgi:hypothetical protein